MRVLTAEEAVAIIGDGWTVATSGFVGSGHPEAVSRALEARFLADGQPGDLTLVYAAGQGDRQARGANRFAHQGMVRRVIAGHLGLAPALGELVAAGKIEAYNWPQGAISQLYRAIAGRKPGVISQIGLHTFIDPRHDGGRLNGVTTEALVELFRHGGREYLFYRAFPIHCALIRGTTADARGNITMEREPFTQDVLAMAQAARNSGGIVIAQVQRLAGRESLNPNLVKVPGILVDYVVVAQPEDHWQTYDEVYNPAYGGERGETEEEFVPLALDIRKVMARRAFLELARLEQPVVNLGFGVPEGIAAVAREEGASGFTLTVEVGPIGGTPAGGLSFGASSYPEAIIDQGYQFDFYDGGGLDIAFLGLAQADGQGNVNVSRFGNRIAGVGGFVNISQSASEVVFCGSLTTGGLEAIVSGGQLEIMREGRIRKFVAKVEHLSFNGPYVEGLGHRVLYVTERAVFALAEGRLVLVEVAPGIDLEAEVLGQVDAEVVVAEGLKEMDPRIFRPEPMGDRR
jgi:propionate CoA-transferase